MEQLPKIVHQRLAKAKGESHPDPNLLAAFSEKLLRDRERIQVLEHLAQCRDCRDVVSLSVPELESAQATAEGSRFNWLGWPVLRWGALATCVVIVGAAVSLRYRTGYREAAFNAVQPSSPVVVATPEQEAAVVAELKSNKNATKQYLRVPTEGDARTTRDLARQSDAPVAADKLEASTARERPREEVTVPLRSQIAAAVPAPEISKNADLQALRKDGGKQAQKPEADDAKASNALASNEVVGVQSEIAEVAPTKTKDESRKKDGAAKSSSGALARGMMSTEGNALADSGRAQGQVVSQAGAKLVPRWTLTSEGTLLRSLDSGKTWQTIPVADKTNLRAVAAIGLEIWVGGSLGLLYHSSDAGGHWVQVKPSANGQFLGTDIIGLEFNDAQNGKLTTSNGETWTTSDAGQSWQKK